MTLDSTNQIPTYPCQSCDNQTYLLMLTSSERTKISAIEYRVGGGMVGKDFLDTSSTGSKYITRGKYSRHLGRRDFLVYVERPQVNVYVIYHCYPLYCEPRCFYFECLCSFGQLQCFWSLDVLVLWKYHEVWRSDNHAVIGIVLLLTKGIYVGIVLRSPWGKIRLENH